MWGSSQLGAPGRTRLITGELGHQQPEGSPGLLRTWGVDSEMRPRRAGLSKEHLLEQNSALHLPRVLVFSGVLTQEPIRNLKTEAGPRFTTPSLLCATLPLPLTFTSICLTREDSPSPILQIRNRSLQGTLVYSRSHRSSYPPQWVRPTTGPIFPSAPWCISWECGDARCFVCLYNSI